MSMKELVMGAMNGTVTVTAGTTTGAGTRSVTEMDHCKSNSSSMATRKIVEKLFLAQLQNPALRLILQLLVEVPPQLRILALL